MQIQRRGTPFKSETLGNLISLEYGSGLTSSDRRGSEYPVFGSNGIVGYHNEYLVKAPGIIVGRKGSIGEVNWSDLDFWAIDTTYYIKLRNENISLKWVYYLLSQKNLKNLNSATGIPGLNRNDVYKVSCFCPPFEEQQKISSILSNVDELIQKTDQIIEQTQRLKKGLMQRLLTKGIGHTKFKKTELGDIPDEWNIKYLGDYVDIMSGEYFAYTEFSNEGIPVLKIDNVAYGNIDWTTRTFLPKEYLRSHNQLVLSEGDIVLALNRPITNNEVKVGMVSIDDSPSLLYQRVGKFKFKTNNLNNQFFFMYLSSTIFKKILSKSLIGSDQPYVKTTELKRKKVAFPGLEEQKNISEILMSISKDIKIKQNQKNYLNYVKRGLMQQLLTGKIRVKV